MNKSKNLMLFIIFSVVFIFANIYTIWGNEKKQVLIIGSYSHNFENFTKQINGLKEGLECEINTHIEYFDYGNYPEAENELNFYNLLKYKMNKYEKYDAIILAEDHAIKFWEKYKEDLFKDIPMVFIGANDNELIERVLKYNNVYGIREGISVDKNISLINKLHPKSNIVAITYCSEAKCDILQNFYSIKDKYKSIDFKHISLSDDGMDLSIEKIKNLNPNTVLLEFYAVGENSFGYDNIKKFKRFLDEQTNIPKYTTMDFDMNKKFIGGVYTDPTRQGYKAGQMVNDIVNGKTPNKRLIQPDEINTYTFNYDIMQKFKIKEKELPQNAKINNKPKSILSEYKELVVSTIIVFISLLVTIVILVNNDIKRKQYEKEILKAKEMAENAHNAQSNFVSTISHELRTPVAVIMSCTQLLELNLSKLGNNIIDTNSKNLDIIKQNGYRMLKIVNNIIDVAKYDSGFMMPKLKNIEMISYLESIVELVIPYANSKNVEIIFDTETEEVIMSVDPYMIERIVLNLLSNAIKFSKDKGEILVNVDTNNNNLIFKVSDNGIGIDEKGLDKIFERFVQLDDTINRKNEGSGIGLSLVHSLVKLHKGTVFVSSKLNVGTCFTIELPIKMLEGESVENWCIYSEDNYLKSTEIEFSDIL